MKIQMVNVFVCLAELQMVGRHNHRLLDFGLLDYFAVRNRVVFQIDAVLLEFSAHHYVCFAAGHFGRVAVFVYVVGEN